MSFDKPSGSFSLNLSGVSDYGSNSPFIDLARSMRAPLAHSPEQWGALGHEQMRDIGALDAAGYPTEVPAGMRTVATIFAWDPQSGNAAYREGVYVFTYEGEAEFTINGAEVLSREQGRIVLRSDGGSLSLEWKDFEPGTHPRNFHLVKAEHEGLFAAGAVFNPDWLEIVGGARDLRLMDWMETNNSRQVDWAGRPQLTDATWSGQGVPVEIMVRLANETGTNPWFTIPHLASDDYIENFAAYVRDNLDPRLEARFEYSNEVAFNWAFSQTQDLGRLAQEEWGTDRWYDYVSMKATKAALIIDRVFAEGEGGGDRPTAIKVLGTHPSNSWITEQLLRADAWRENDPDGYVDPASVFDEIATTTYFGGSVMSEPVLFMDLLAQIEADPVAARDWLKDRLMDPGYEASIPMVETWLEAHAAIAHGHGLKLVSYEGGQHVHHSFAIPISPEQAEMVTPWMTEFVRSPQMAELYLELTEVWSRHGDGAFMQFGDVGDPSRWGSWAILSDMLDDNPRARALFETIAGRAPWWEGSHEDGGFTAGASFAGTRGDDRIVGTDEDDNLAGMLGSDVFLLGGGNDRVSGGAGRDIVFLQGNRADWTISAEVNGVILARNGSTEKHLVGIEKIVFSDRAMLTMGGEGDRSGMDPVGDGSDTTVPPPPPPPPPDDDDGSGSTPVQPGEIEGDFNGRTIDAQGGVSYAEHATGMVIQAINPWSDVGAALHAEGMSIYAVHRAEAAITLDGVRIGVDYFTLNDGQTAGGLNLGATPVEGALRFADLHHNAAGIHGTAHADMMIGHDANELLDGGEGDDYIYGGRGNDYLIGGEGNDTLVAGPGFDLLSGGAGADVFVFHDDDGGTSIIMDFTPEDRIEFRQGAGEPVIWGLSANSHLTLTHAGGEIVFEGLAELDRDWILFL